MHGKEKSAPSLRIAVQAELLGRWWLDGAGAWGRVLREGKQFSAIRGFMLLELPFPDPHQRLVKDSLCSPLHSSTQS